MLYQVSARDRLLAYLLPFIQNSQSSFKAKLFKIIVHFLQLKKDACLSF